MLQAKDIMTKKVVTVYEDTKIQDVCKILIKDKLSGVPVVDKKYNLVGFISERDIIVKITLKNFLQKKAKDLMTKDVLSVCYDTPTEDVARLFTEKPYRYLPVIKQNKIVGIISRKDVIDRLLGQYY